MEHGVTIGIVSARKDEDGLARVKLKLRLYGDTETDWVRIAVPFGGSANGAHGFMWIPEEGDEVLVAFVNGDPKAPVVIGSLYSAQRKPPSAEPDERVLKTRKGHCILISDKDGEERIEITTGGGLKLALDDKSGTITVKAKQKVVVDAPAIDLGGSGGQKAILGEAFLQVFNTHTHPVSLGVAGPTLPGALPVVLSNVTKLGG